MLRPSQLVRPLAGTVVYPPGRPAETLLAAFADEVKRRGWRVGGLVQRTLRDANGRKLGMELQELDTGQVVSIGQPLGSGAGGDACAVDPAAVADSTAALRRAIADKVDLLVFNKWSFLEKGGRGMADEMLEAMAGGLPVLTSVQAPLLQDWWTFSGGRCRLLPMERTALWQWWGRQRLYQDLVLGVGDGMALRVVVGQNFTLVEGPHGVGLASTPPRNAPGCKPAPEAGRYAGRSLRELAALVESWNPAEVAIGLAAIGAHNNRYDLAGEASNGLDSLPADGRVVVVGGFPGIRDRLPGCHVVEMAPEDGEYPAAAADWLLPTCDVAVMTASALTNHSLPRLLELAEGARVALVGPSTPLCPRLFDHGIEVLSGLVATDPDGLARVIAEGGAARDAKRYGRPVTLRRS